MKLRDYLGRRQKRFAIVAAALAFACAMRLSFIGYGRFAGLLFPGFVAAIVIQWGCARCPRCGASIGYLELGRPSRYSGKQGLDHCARCGLHRDEEIATPSRRDGA